MLPIYLQRSSELLLVELSLRQRDRECSETRLNRHFIEAVCSFWDTTHPSSET